MNKRQLKKIVKRYGPAYEYLGERLPFSKNKLKRMRVGVWEQLSKTQTNVETSPIPDQIITFVKSKNGSVGALVLPLKDEAVEHNEWVKFDINLMDNIVKELRASGVKPLNND